MFLYLCLGVVFVKKNVGCVIRSARHEVMGQSFVQQRARDIGKISSEIYRAI